MCGGDKFEIPVVLQSGAKDCGLASLLMILRYYSGNCSLEYLKSFTDIGNDGLDMYTLLLLGNKLGFSCKGVRGNYLELEKCMLPCIAHVKIKKSYLHYVVIYKIDKNKKKVLLADPSRGLIKMSFDEFNNIKTDNYLILKLTKTPIYVVSKSKILSVCFNYLKENKTLIIYLTSLSIVITILTIICSFRLEAIVNLVLNNNSFSNLISVSIIFLTFVVLREVSVYYKNHLVNYFWCTLDQKLITTIYEKLLSLPRLYYKNHSTGEVISRIQDMNVVKEFIISVLTTAVTDTVMFIISLITLFYLNSGLTIIVVLSCVILLFIYMINIYDIGEYLKILKKESGHVTSLLTETISGMESVRNLGIETKFLNKFSFLYSNYLNDFYNYQSLIIKKDFFVELVTVISELLIVVVGVAFVIKTKIVFPTLVTYLSLIVYIYTPIKNHIQLFLRFFDSRLSYNRINEILLLENDNGSKRRKKHLMLEGNIRISNLSYAYDNDECLTNINIKIKKGEHVLISGKSGSGKSTLAKILVGGIKPKRNCVFVDDIDILDIDYKCLNQVFSYISQSEMLFTDTLYNNIVLYRDISYEEVLKFCKMTLVDEFILKNTMAYDLMIEEDGYNISGGERARIILARNLLKQSEVYILDETFSAIDVTRERIILKNIFTKFKDKTIIVISHRFYNDDLFDRKLTIDKGIIYENR